MEKQEQQAAKEAQLAQYLAEKGIDPAAGQNPSILSHELESVESLRNPQRRSHVDPSWEALLVCQVP